MRRISFFLVLCVGLMLAVPANAQDTNTPLFEAAACMFTVPKNQSPDCGYLTVPEDRSQATGNTIKLAVAVFHSEDPDKSATPLIYLEGGPGGSALEFLSQTFDSRYAKLLENQDVIIFDQRGVGRSEPALDCQEITDLMVNSLDKVLTVDEAVSEMNTASSACAARLAGNGIHLGSYNSAENAADVNDLRIALGYDKLDLYGISYGTKLALTIMRDHPEAVRSAIIDSIFPPQVTNNDAPLNFERSLNVLFKGCAANAECNTAFPDLEAVFYDTIDQLNAKPLRFEVFDPTTAQKRDVVLDGDGFAGYVFQAMYATEMIPSMPKNIYDVHNGDTRFLSLWTLLQLSQLDAVSIGMNYAVQCTEEIPFDTTSSIDAMLTKLNPKLVGFARRNGIDDSQFNLCSTWNNQKPKAIENQIVTSDIPTLAVSGEYDPITPPAYGKATAAALSKSYYFVFPGVGHGVIPSSECALSIAQAFLNDPTQKPNASCIDEMKEPQFTIGNETKAAVELEPFSNATAGYSGVKPKGWQEAAAGTYARASSPLDAVALSFQIVPGGNVDLVVPLIGKQFGLDEKQVITREANGLKWRILAGELQGIPVNMALADSKGKVYLILFLSNADEKDALYEQIFLPVVDAFKPN